MKGENKVRGKVGKGRIMGEVGADPNEKGMSKEEIDAYRAGKRRDGESIDKIVNKVSK